MVTFSALYPVFFPCRPFSCCRYFWTWWSCETCVATTAKDAQFETYIALCIKIEELVWSVWMALDLDAVYRCFGTIRAFPTTWYKKNTIRESMVRSKTEGRSPKLWVVAVLLHNAEVLLPFGQSTKSGHQHFTGRSTRAKSFRLCHAESITCLDHPE